MTAAMIAELLAVKCFGSIAVHLPRLAHLATGAPVARTMALVMHGEALDVQAR